MLFGIVFSLRGGVNVIELVWLCDVYIMWHVDTVENFTLMAEVLSTGPARSGLKVVKNAKRALITLL